MAKKTHIAAEIRILGARLSWICASSYSISDGEREFGILTWQQSPEGNVEMDSCVGGGSRKPTFSGWARDISIYLIRPHTFAQTLGWRRWRRRSLERCDPLRWGGLRLLCASFAQQGDCGSCFDKQDENPKRTSQCSWFCEAAVTDYPIMISLHFGD